MRCSKIPVEAPEVAKTQKEERGCWLKWHLFICSKSSPGCPGWGSGGSILGDHQSLPGHPGLSLSVGIPILGGWAMCPCVRHGSSSCAGSSLRRPGCPTGTLELVPGDHSSSSIASDLWSGGGAPFPGRLSGSSGFSWICPGFAFLSRAVAWRNPSLPPGVCHSSSRGCHGRALDCVCHQHPSSSSASGF